MACRYNAVDQLLVKERRNKMNEIEMNKGEPIVRPSYIEFSKAIETAFNKLAIQNKVLYRTKIKHGALREAFSNSFPEGAVRQYENCSCCASFIGRYGHLTYIDIVDGQYVLKSALWNGLENLDPHWNDAVAAMKKLVEKSDILSVWYSDYKVLGTKQEGGFNHLNIERITTHTQVGIKSFGEMMAATMEDYKALAETIGTADIDTINNALKYFTHDKQLSNMDSRIDALTWFKNTKSAHMATKNRREKELIVWNAIGTEKMDRLRIGSSVMGEFMTNLKNGDGFEVAKRKFLAMTDSLKYKRATTPPKAGTVMQAEKVFETMSMASSLVRRFASLAEARRKVWLPKADEVKPAEPTSLFGHLKTKSPEPVVAAKLPEVIEGPMLTWQRFAAQVLPKAEKLRIVVPHGNANFGAITTTVDPEAKPLVEWDREEERNPFAEYSYHGGTPAHIWGLRPGALVEVDAIISTPSSDRDYDKDPTVGHRMIVIKGAADTHMRQIPLGTGWIRHEFHEIRSVLENFFKTGKMAEQPEEFPPFAGLFVHHADSAPVGYTLQALIDGVWVQHRIDRFN